MEQKKVFVKPVTGGKRIEVTKGQAETLIRRSEYWELDDLNWTVINGKYLIETPVEEA